MGNRIIGLLTDFGLQDYFVASLKGVILSINPEAEIVDITHDLPDYSLQLQPLSYWPATAFSRTRSIF